MRRSPSCHICFLIAMNRSPPSTDLTSPLVQTSPSLKKTTNPSKPLDVRQPKWCLGNKGHLLPLFRLFSGSCLSALRLKAKFFFLFLTILLLCFKIYVFIFGCAGSLFLCSDLLQLPGLGATHCSGFSSCRVWALGQLGSLVSLMGLVALSHVGSSRLRVKPAFPPLASGFFTTGPPGKSTKLFYTLQQHWGAS